jgi:succinyl-diaminopimelate desuccinylase
MIDLDQDLSSILSELIKIPSPTKDEAELLSAIKGSIKRFKLKTEYDEACNLLLCLNPDSASSKTLVLAGHLDTVPATDPKQLTPKIEHGASGPVMHGRGSVDMKAGLAVMLKLASDFDKGLLKLKYKTKLLFYSGEEGPLPNGLNNVLNSGKLSDASACIILEPTSSKFAVGCMGAITAEITVSGKASHSAWPNKGSNAIYNSVDLIEKVKSFGVKKASLDGMDFFETMNITKIRTDNPHNVIPDRVSLTLNYRFSPNKTVEEANQSLLDYLNIDQSNISLKNTNTTNTISIIDTSPSSYIGNLPNKFFDTEFFASSHKNIEKIIFQAWSDIAQLNDHGTPAINYGPGNITYAHMNDEQINLNELKSYYESIKEMI